MNKAPQIDNIKEAIEKFNLQFEYEPVIQNAGNLKKFNKFIVSGMGGSHLAADLLKDLKPELDMIIHKDYGLPQISAEELASRLFIASSYSGNTEEVLDGLKEALSKNMSVVVIAVGGELLRIANERSLPFIQIPATGIHPRSALGFSLRAFLKATGDGENLSKTREAADLDPKDFEKQGEELAKRLKGYVPIIYSSNRNKAVAYNWKIKFNETGKIPAFYNVFPELNHNEMTGFDVKDQSKFLSEKFYFILLEDQADRPQIQKRMQILKQLYTDRGLKVETMPVDGENIFLKIFSSLIVADWASYHTALIYGLEPAKVPMIEEFKKLVSQE